LPLVRYPNRGELGRRDAGRGQRARGDLFDARPELERIVFHPTWLRQDLTKVALREANRRSGPVENDAAATGRAQIEGCHVVSIRR
jgi:hypothetical protein